MKQRAKDSIKNKLGNITGVTLGPVGLSWQASDKLDEHETIRKFILFLEDRRILYSPETGHSIASHFVVQGLNQSACLSPHAEKSIREMREEIRILLDALPEKSANIRILKRLEATCRWALDCADKMQSDIVRQDADYEDIWGRVGVLEYGMTFLGLFRRKMGRDIKELAELQDIRVEGPLKKMIEMTIPIKKLDPQIFLEADKLVTPYMEKHGGFRNMRRGWFEKLCKELINYTAPWE